jgi:CheY-like chemotaxis protein
MSKICSILLVEDDENDAFFLKRALKELGFDGRLFHHTATDSAKDYLLGNGESADRETYPLPEMVIADSAVTVRDSGVEFLEWIRRRGIVPNAPFIILSGGVSDETRARADAAGVRKIVSKGKDHHELVKELRSILQEFPVECREWLK